MILKRFSIGVLARTILLCITTFTFFYLLMQTSFVATPFIVAVLILIQIYSIVKYVQRTNQEITRFFESIKYGDFSQNFTVGIKGSSFDELHRAFSGVIDEFRKARAEKEEQYRYLQIVVQHVGIGLIAYTQDGSVELLNAAAKKLLNVNTLRSIDDLAAIDPLFVTALKNVSSGDKQLVTISVDGEAMQLSIYATEFKLRDNRYTLVSLTNIQTELEEREMEAWHNLIRVLTHEIMNSLTPISSLASTAHEILTTIPHDKQDDPLFHETIEDVTQALATIKSRSHGLFNFVESYRELMHVPQPNFSLVPFQELFAHVVPLMQPKFQEKGITFLYRIEPETLEATADMNLIEQVLINLLQNALEWAEQNMDATVSLIAGMGTHGRPTIQVIDNGPGIPPDRLQKIFIPFYSTKPKGSGVGLSLSRQIMHLHHGSLTVVSEKGNGTIFTLKF